MPTPAQAAMLVCGAALAAITGWLVVSRRRLATAADRFERFMEHGPFVAFIKDAHGRYVYENRAAVEEVAKIRPGTTTMIGRTDREVFTIDQGATYVDHDRDSLAHGAPLQFQEVSRNADGSVRHWSTIRFPIRDASGQRGVAGISIDVTELWQARTDARASEDRHALALAAGRMGDFTLDLASRVIETSPLFATLHGRPETKTRLTLEESLAEVHPDDHRAVVEAVEACLQDRAPNRITYRVVGPGEAPRWIEVVGQVFADETGRPAVVRGVACDVTEQRSAYEELTRGKEILRRLIDVQENERQTLCHDLHDGAIQFSIGAKMQLEAARDEPDPAARTERIDAAIDALNRGIAECRQVIRGVRPAVLDDLGLQAAIEDLAEQMEAAGIHVALHVDAGLDDVPPQVRTTIYRVVQESLTNVRKHAGTDRATVVIRRAGDEVHVQVRDRGRGCDAEEGGRRGFGVVGMTERVRLAGGTFAVESQPGVGTEVSARLSVSAAERETPE